uniref:AlNc14C40G3422 protein n=1 Tax=Albugo laibachii Nc14 TaxID=890382 RepID=F0W9G3_9STRA|nr:AlNc14C40G3422 [Albugo laibachii Nc14]|eukprot:CCA17777.1 AlNc14C40G3422 [Albugo laibachii Nc14]
MGSYLAIANDTPYDSHCKVTVDHKALAIGLGVAAFLVTLVTSLGVGLLVGGVSGAVALTAGITLGGGGTLLAAFTGPAFQVTALAAKANNISPFTLASASGIRSELAHKKYVLIRAGERHVYGKYSLGLLRQAVCARPIILSSTEVTVEYIAAHMIWSGYTVDSTNTYRIQKLKSEHTVKNYRVTCQPPGTKKDSSGQITSPLSSNFLPTTTQPLPTGQYGLQPQLGVPIEPVHRHLVANQTN